MHVFISLFNYTKNKNLEEIRGRCGERKRNEKKMTNVTYNVKTLANMMICQEGKFQEMYTFGEEQVTQYKIRADKHRAQVLQFF